MEQYEFKVKNFAASLLILGFIIGTYFAYNEPLFKYSETIVKDLKI